MIQRLLALALILAPALCLAQETSAPAPVETPWGAMIGFLVVCVIATAWTVWAVFFKKDGGNETSKD